MIGKLTDEQIDQVIACQSVGRIGCHLDGRTYIVPIAFAFDGSYIYAHSRVGMKIEIMRKNPSVCFQVDVMENMASWRSVILQGDFEELTTSALQLKAFNILRDRLSPLVTSEAVKTVERPSPGEKRLRPIFFRIAIREKSGRFEKR